jgi:hypothetical protein
MDITETRVACRGKPSGVAVDTSRFRVAKSGGFGVSHRR